MILKRILYTPKNLMRNIFSMMFSFIICKDSFPKEARVIDKNSSDLLNRHWLPCDEKGVLICDACGICEDSCPTNSIAISKNGNKIRNFEIDYGHCITCYKCVESCPKSAIIKNENYRAAGFPEERWKHNKRDLELKK